MYGLISILYDEPKQKAFEELYIDSDSKDQLLLRSTLAEALKDCPRILPSHGSDFLLCTLTSYHKSAYDTFRIYQSIMRCFDKFSFGLLDDDIRWKDLNHIADECLVGIGFFKQYLKEKHKRKATPSVEYYSDVGSSSFSRLGYENIAKDFKGWTSFIESELAIASII